MQTMITNALEDSNTKIIEAINRNNDVLGKLTNFLERKFS